MNKENMFTEEELSKAIDDLLNQTFGKSEGDKEDDEEVKGKEKDGLKPGKLAEDQKVADGTMENQPENKFDELPKDEDVKANGGQDVIKAKMKKADEEIKPEEDKKEDEEKKEMDKSEEMLIDEKKEEEKKDDTQKCMKKSANTLYKSVMKQNDELKKSVDQLNTKLEKAGDIIKAMKKEMDLLKARPQPRKSIKSVEAIEKSFNRVETNTPTLNKSQIESTIETLVKSGRVPSTVATEYELYGKISHPEHRNLIIRESLKKSK